MDKGKCGPRKHSLKFEHGSTLYKFTEFSIRRW